MAKPVRGLPTDFELDLPKETPVDIGDFLDEAPQLPQARRVFEQPQTEAFVSKVVSPRPVESRGVDRERTTNRAAQPSKVIRYQLNLSPKSKTMFEELMKHVQTFSPEGDTRTSEVLQGVIGLLHGAMDELELTGVPRRGAWGSVTAKNFPIALGNAFEAAIIRAARKRGAA